MKDTTNELFLSVHMLKENNYFEDLQSSIKYGIFGLFYLLLKNQDINLWVEVICIIAQLLELVAFPFHLKFVNIWKKDNSYIQISNIIQYFQIFPFFKDNQEMYLIAFYVCVILVVLTITDIIYIAFAFANNKLSMMWPLQFLRGVISFQVRAFFLPILAMFLSIFICSNSQNEVVSEIKCWSGAFYVHAVFGILMSILFILMTFLVQCTYFETKFGTHNPIAKSTSQADCFLVLVKIILVIIFTFLNKTGDNQWIIIAFLIFLSGYLVYSYYEHQPYYNHITMKMYNCLTLIFLWSNLVLLISKILEKSKFDGGLGLFFLGLPVIIAVIFTGKDQILAGLVINLIKMSKGEKALNQIQYFISLIDKKDTSRNSKVLLKGYIEQFEETCALKDCPLKKYINSLKNNNIDAIVFLLQHCETMYQTAISKFPMCTSLRISYAFFLLERMNKKQQASLELANTEKHFPKFEEQFIIYRYKKLLEEQSTDLNDNEDNLDMVSNIEYKNHFILFKNSITKVAALYLEFWSLLLNPNQDCQEDLTKLNDYGTKINTLVEEINNHFEKIQKLKHNDQETIKYYSDFLNDILNDKEKAQKYKNKLNEIEDTKQNTDENNIMNLDITALNSNSEYQYIIVSAQPEKFGVITNLSLGICSMFGYTRNELVGKSLEMIMPEIFHKEHRELLLDKVNDFKKQSIDINDMKNYKPQFKDISTFGRNKSRYLVQMTFKTALIPTENNDNVFIAKIWQDLMSLGTLEHSICYIITNNYLTIQNFTPNAVSLLGMSSGAINSTVEITEFIKQFYEEFLKYAVENEDKTPEQKLLLKRTLLAKKFKSPSIINWKRYDIAESRMKSSKAINHNSSDAEETELGYHSIAKINSRGVGSTEELFILTVSDAVIRNKQEGYIFKFETLTQANKNSLKNTNSIIAMNKNTSNEKLSKVNSKKGIDLTITSVKQKQTETPDDNIYKPMNSNNFGNSTIMAAPFIDQYYIPNSQFNFHLDPKAMSYKVNNDPNFDLKEYLKQEAIKKIQPPESKDKTEIESGTEEEESSSFGNGTSSNEDESSNISGISNDKNIAIPSAANVVKIKGADEYYKVNMTHIKFSIYNFQRKTTVDVKDWERIDQVQLKMTEDHRKKESDGISENDTKEATNSNDISIPGQNNISEEQANANKESVLIKQIEYALGREEAQPSIAKLRWVAFASVILLLAAGGGLLANVLTSYKTLNENVTIINYAYYLIVMNSYGIYYTRELTLLNSENYTSIPGDRNIYRENCINSTVDIFINSHDVITYIMTSFLSVSESNQDILSNTQILTTIIEDDYKTSTFNLTMNSAFIEANTALFHVGHYEKGNVIPTNKDTFFYLYNSLNDVAGGLKIQAEIYLDELNVNSNRIKLIYSITLGLILIVLIAICICVSYAYESVAKRKESYLEVFFEIGNNVIKASLEKCENFTKKIQSDSISDALSTGDDVDLGEEKLIIEKDANRKEHRGKRKNTSSRETKMFKLKMSITIVLVGVFCILVFTFYWLFLNDLHLYMDFYKTMTELENEYLQLFNALREYMFDPNNMILNTPADEFLTECLGEIYTRRQEKQLFLSENIKKVPKQFQSVYTNIYLRNCCSNRGEYFESDEECEAFMSSSSNYGLEIMLTYFVEEIRYSKILTEKQNQKREETPYKFNLTLIGTEAIKDLWPTDSDEQEEYAKLLQIEDFNYENVHKNLNIMFKELIFPNHNELRMTYIDSVKKKLKNNRLLYVIIISVYLGLVFAFYLCIWIPFEKRLNQTIYKTKNMLSIIPKEVLASLANIHKLLDIGQSFAKGQNRQVKK